jgi:hypothetical protein
MAQHGNLKDKFRKIEVPCDTLDNIMSRSPRIDFVKLDVEGAEEMVLKGGRKFIAEHKPLILFHCGPSGPKAFGRKPADLFCTITQELGYEVYSLDEFLRGGSSVDAESFETALTYPFKAFKWIAQDRD